ncbi:MAG TPA: PAS domain-containing protein [Burkholderiales bacterium]|jgi:PAS domain S-box-containing protein|nr:PAS domain-containing protein [Burkholderiales bacterium]
MPLSPRTKSPAVTAELDAFIRAAPHLVVVLAPDFTVIAANDAVVRATKVSREDLIGRNVFDVFPDSADRDANDTAQLRESLERVLETRVADTMQTQRYDVRRAPDAGGELERRYWKRVNYPVLDADGRVRCIVHQSEEITELVELRTERAQAEVDTEATEILESITDGFFAVDREWRFTYANRQAQRILGRTRADLLGKALWDAYPGLAGSDFEGAYVRTMTQRVASSFTSYYPDHDRWYEVHAYPAPEGISVYFRNVTEQRRIEAERERLVAESEKQRRIYEAALSNTPDLIYVFDLEHRFAYANEALLRMWGRSPEDALGKTCLELGYEPWHAEMHDREIEQVVATRQPIRGEVPFTGTNGRRIYEYIFVPVIGVNGEVVAVAGTTRDVTERQQSEQAMREQAERLRESDRAKDEFLATLAHELRNPLAPIANSLEVLKRAGENREAAARARGTIDRQITHLVRLVDDLLDVSRITRGKLELRTQRIALASIVEQALESCRPHLDAAGHALTIATPGTPIFVEADPVRLVQVLSNLLNNATKYTPNGGRIAVSVEVSGAHVRITVKDTGIGIAPEMIEQVFDMFIRADHSLERAHDGLGIGLTLAKRLVELHGGTLSARSAGLAQGSEFTVQLPLAQRESAPQTSPHDDTGAVSTRRVLVVDDNLDSAASLAMLLEFAGHETRTAHDGEDAIAVAAQYRPDVILLDIGLPKMNGYDACRVIRAQPGGKDTLIVALTGWGQDDDRRRSREAGFDAHLVKPADYPALVKLLATPRRATIGE